MKEHTLKPEDQRVLERLLNKFAQKQLELALIKQMMDEEIAVIQAREKLPQNVILDQTQEKWRLIEDKDAPKAKPEPPGGKSV